MSEEKEKNPKLEFKKVVKMGKPIKVTLKSSKHIADGDGKYGPWFLWKANVDKIDVTDANDTNKTIKDYSGDVVFFAPTDKFQEQLMAITNGEEEDVKIEVNKEALELNDGKIVGKWVVKKLEGGKISPSALKPSEKNLIEDVKEHINKGYEISEDEFIQLSKEDSYAEANISEERAKELYKQLR